MKKFLILMFLIVAMIIFASSCGNTPDSNIPEKILELGKATTVFITGRSDSGSGVIIDKQDDLYYVLTAAHVVGTKPSEEEVKYELQTIDKEKHPIADHSNYHKKVQKFPQNTDLAVIEFRAKKNQQYQTVSLAKSTFRGMPVYAFGWTNCEEEQKPIFQITEGVICEIQLKDENGWDLHYSNNTIQGVSGGAIIDQNGHLIAIQAGLKGGGSHNQKCKPAPQKPNEKYAHGLGISIGTKFEKLKLKLSTKSQIKLNAGINPPKNSSNNIMCRKAVDEDQPPILPTTPKN
jgi:hypothetical protein